MCGWKESRRYARLESYLIPLDEWEKIRPQVCDLLNLPTNADQRIYIIQAELHELYGQFDRFFDKTKASESEDSMILFHCYRYAINK